MIISNTLKSKFEKVIKSMYPNRVIEYKLIDETTVQIEIYEPDNKEQGMFLQQWANEGWCERALNSAAHFYLMD